VAGTARGIREQQLSVAKHEKGRVPTFEGVTKASPGWIAGVRKRNKLSVRTLHGDANDIRLMHDDHEAQEAAGDEVIEDSSL
jgi:hypothetical protein